MGRVELKIKTNSGYLQHFSFKIILILNKIMLQFLIFLISFDFHQIVTSIAIFRNSGLQWSFSTCSFVIILPESSGLSPGFSI